MSFNPHPTPSIGARSARRLWATAAIAAASASLTVAASAAPLVDTVYRSIETPYPAPGPFHPATTAYFQFRTAAELDRGLTLGNGNLWDQALGSFGGSTGLSLSFGSVVTATLRSSASLWADVANTVNPIAFVEWSAGTNKYVHVADGGSASQDRVMFELQFSHAITGFGFIGAGISDYFGHTGPAAPSQRIQLDERAPIDVVAQDPYTIQNPVHLSFGVIAATPFSSVRLILPAGSLADNAALTNLTIAYDPTTLTAVVPEPGAWALMLAGAAVLLQLQRKRLAGAA
jgi:hypothetical protein